MSRSQIIPYRAAALIPLLLVLTLALSGCSGDGGGSDGGSGGSGEAPQTSAASGETASGSTAGDAVAEGASTGPASTESTSAQGDSGGITALSEGLEKARSEAESWNRDAALYAIISRPPDVNAEGENSGWLYSFVSESAGSIIIIPYRDGEVQDARGQELPESQIERIAGDTLPVDRLIDSPEALRRSDEVRSYLEQNPEAGASVSVDSASGGEPEWILQVPQEMLQERVPAVE